MYWKAALQMCRHTFPFHSIEISLFILIKVTLCSVGNIPTHVWNPRFELVESDSGRSESNRNQN